MSLERNSTTYKSLVNQLLVNGIVNFSIIDIFLQTSKSNFLPDTYKGLNWGDYIIFFKNNRFILDNSTLLFLLQIAEFNPEDNILVIGSDLGFSLALLSKIVSNITCVEEDSEIIDITNSNLLNSNIKNVNLIQGKFKSVVSSKESFNGILINGAFYKLSTNWSLQLDNNKSIIGIHRKDHLSQIVKITKHKSDLIWQYYKHCNVPYLKGLDKCKTFKL